MTPCIHTCMKLHVSIKNSTSWSVTAAACEAWPHFKTPTNPETCDLWYSEGPHFSLTTWLVDSKHSTYLRVPTTHNCFLQNLTSRRLTHMPMIIEWASRWIMFFKQWMCCCRRLHTSHKRIASKRANNRSPSYNEKKPCSLNSNHCLYCDQQHHNTSFYSKLSHTNLIWRHKHFLYWNCNPHQFSH